MDELEPAVQARGQGAKLEARDMLRLEQGRFVERRDSDHMPACLARQLIKFVPPLWEVLDRVRAEDGVGLMRHAPLGRQREPVVRVALGGNLYCSEGKIRPPHIGTRKCGRNNRHCVSLGASEIENGTTLARKIFAQPVRQHPQCESGEETGLLGPTAVLPVAEKATIPIPG